MTEIISFSISAELRRKIDELRGDVPRSKYIVRLIESAISKCINIDSSAGTSSEAAQRQKIVRG